MEGRAGIDVERAAATADVNRVGFNFAFAAGDAGIITSIGFGGTNSGFLTGSPTFFPGSGVSFESDTNLPNLGGGGFTQDYGVSRTSQGGVSNGMSNGETLGVQYSLSGINSLANVVNAINGGTFLIGLHIQALDDGGSQKAVLTPGNGNIVGVPDGGTTAVLLGLALTGLAVGRRFASKS